MTRPLHSNRLGDVCLVACIGLWIAQSVRATHSRQTSGELKSNFECIGDDPACADYFGVQQTVLYRVGEQFIVLARTSHISRQHVFVWERVCPAGYIALFFASYALFCVKVFAF